MIAMHVRGNVRCDEVFKCRMKRGSQTGLFFCFAMEKLLLPPLTHEKEEVSENGQGDYCNEKEVIAKKIHVAKIVVHLTWQIVKRNLQCCTCSQDGSCRTYLE